MKKGLNPCYFPGSLGSEVWHPICKQAARAEKKLKVSKLVMMPAQHFCMTTVVKVWGGLLLYRIFIPLCVHSKHMPLLLAFLNGNTCLVQFLRRLRHWHESTLKIVKHYICVGF